MVEAQASVARLLGRQEALGADLEKLELAIGDAQLAVARAAACHCGVDLADMATTLQSLQSLLSGARDAVGSGQGAQLIESINNRAQATGAAFPAARGPQAAPAAAGAAAPAAATAAAAPDAEPEASGCLQPAAFRPEPSQVVSSAARAWEQAGTED